MILRMSHKIRRVTVTEAARNFADIVNRAYYRGETTVLTRNGTPVAHIAPAAPTGVKASEFLARWRLRRKLSPEDAEALGREIEKARAELPPVRDPWA